MRNVATHRIQDHVYVPRNLISTTDPDNNTTTYVYDAADQLTETHRADTSVLRTSYWPDGSVQAQTDAANHAATYAYDPLARLSTVTDPLNNVTTYFYDGVGNLTGKQDPGGNCAATPKVGCTSTAYDAACLLPWTRRARSLDDLDPFNQMLAIAETGGHLVLLTAQGRVTAADDGDTRHYRIS